MDNTIKQIGDTPLSISIYSVESMPTHMNIPGTVEIILCLKGSVDFGYAYEDFRLRSGNYIAVDRDAHFLHKGKDNVCVSFFIDMLRYKEKYPFIEHQMYVCEGTTDTDFPGYPTRAHTQLKGLMIAVLKSLLEDEKPEKIRNIVDKMVDLLVNRFDIAFYHYGSQDMSPKILNRIRDFNQYAHEHLTEKIMIGDVAEHLGVTESYLSEFMRKNSIGFRDNIGYLRANKSEWYLLNTDKTIMEISEECGFSDTKYYYSTFKRWYKCTPRQFRDRYCISMEKEMEDVNIRDVEDVINDMLRKHFMDIFAGAN